jgi:hypothetical protein
MDILDSDGTKQKIVDDGVVNIVVDNPKGE